MRREALARSGRQRRKGPEGKHSDERAEASAASTSFAATSAQKPLQPAHHSDASPLDATQRRHTMRLKAMQFSRIQQHRVPRLLRVEALGTIQQNVLPLLRRHCHWACLRTAKRSRERKKKFTVLNVGAPGPRGRGSHQEWQGLRTDTVLWYGCVLTVAVCHSRGLRDSSRLIRSQSGVSWPWSLCFFVPAVPQRRCPRLFMLVDAFLDACT